MKVPSLYNYFKIDFIIYVLIKLGQLNAISGIIKFSILHSVIGDKKSLLYDL